MIEFGGIDCLSIVSKMGEWIDSFKESITLIHHGLRVTLGEGCEILIYCWFTVFSIIFSEELFMSRAFLL